MNDETELTPLLQGLERTLQPTADERERAEGRMWTLFRELAEGDEQPVDGASRHPRAAGTVEIVRLREIDKTKRAVRVSLPRLAAAAVAVIVGVALAAVASNDTVDVRTTTDPASRTNPVDNTDPTDNTDLVEDVLTETVLTDDDVGATLTAGRYSVTLDNTAISFDLVDTRSVSTIGNTTAVLDAIDSPIESNPRRLAFAIASNPFEGQDATTWLTEQGASVVDSGAVVNGERALNLEIDVDDPTCEALSPCLSLPTDSALVDETITLVDGNNRLLTLDLDDKRVLLVLDTSGGNRSGQSQVAYNTVVATLSVD